MHKILGMTGQQKFPRIQGNHALARVDMQTRPSGLLIAQRQHKVEYTCHMGYYIVALSDSSTAIFLEWRWHRLRLSSLFIRPVLSTAWASIWSKCCDYRSRLLAYHKKFGVTHCHSQHIPPMLGICAPLSHSRGFFRSVLSQALWDIPLDTMDFGRRCIWSKG